MIGAWTVDVRSARPFTIHSDLYYELLVTRPEGPADQGLVLRVPVHAFGSTDPGNAPQPGERWELTFLMGQVTSAKRA